MGDPHLQAALMTLQEATELLPIAGAAQPLVERLIQVCYDLIAAQQGSSAHEAEAAP